MAAWNHPPVQAWAEEYWDSMQMSFLHFLAQETRSDIANYGNDEDSDMSGSTRQGSDHDSAPVAQEDRRWISVAEFRARRTGILYPALPPLSGLPPLPHLQGTGDEDDDAWEEGDLEQLFQLDYDPDKPCYLMSVPREIRDAIYDNLVTTPEYTRVIPGDYPRGSGHWNWTWPTDFKPHLNILACCRALKAEAEEAYYRRNTFVISPDNPRIVQEVFAPDVAPLLRSLEIFYTSTDRVSSSGISPAAAKLIESMPGRGGPLCPADAQLLKAWTQKSSFVATLPALRHLTVDLSLCTWICAPKRAVGGVWPTLLAMLYKRVDGEMPTVELQLTGLQLREMQWFMRYRESRFQKYAEHV